MGAAHCLALLLLLALPSAAAQDAAVSEEVGSGAASFASSIHTAQFSTLPTKAPMPTSAVAGKKLKVFAM